MKRLDDLRVTGRGVSGRAFEMEIDYEDVHGRPACLRVRSEYRIREVLHEKFLFSSAFAVRHERDASGVPQRFELVGAGWGHGAGLCQIGALGMAVRGYACRDILRHYFEGVELRRLY
jgi:SpoIID/LytB domain protein